MRRPGILEKAITRRQFLRASTLAVAGGTFAAYGGRWGFGLEDESSLPTRLSAVQEKASNVLVIVLDTVRYDRFAPVIEHSLTPNLDRFAAKGVRFENAWANSSWSLPSQASILTGRYPHEHGADWPTLDLSRDYPTLAEYFSSLGYATGAFSSNSSWITPEYLGRGFLRFDVYTLEDHIRRTTHGRKLDRIAQEFGLHYAGRGKKAPTVNSQFTEFLDDYRENPFFAYICYMDVNQGFHNRRLNRGFWEERRTVQEVIESYDQALNVLDLQIGDLLAELEIRGILQNTLVIITSDHGESFGADGTSDNDPEGHGTSLYPEQTRVPLFVIYPGQVPSGQVVTQPVGLDAIPATITSLLGLNNSPFPGNPLPLTHGGGDSSVLTTLSYDDQNMQAVISSNWLYISNLDGPIKGEELYDLAADPTAKTNLFAADAVPDSVRESLQKSLAARF